MKNPPAVTGRYLSKFDSSSVTTENINEFKSTSVTAEEVNGLKTSSITGEEVNEFKSSAITGEEVNEFKISSVTAEEVNEFKTLASGQSLDEFKSSSIIAEEINEFKSTAVTSKKLNEFNVTSSVARGLNDFASAIIKGKYLREFKVSAAKYVVNFQDILTDLSDLADLTNITEFLSFTYSKSAADDFLSVIDESTIRTGKGFVEVFSISEEINSLVVDKNLFETPLVLEDPNFEIFKVLEDETTFALEDANFGIGKPFADTINSAEFSVFNFNKGEFDFVQASESKVFFLDKIQSDSASISDNFIYDVNKLLVDTVLGKDLLGITDGSTFSFGMKEADLTYASDILTRVWVAFKNLADSTQINEFLSYAANKNLSDSAQAIESVIIDFVFRRAFTDLSEVVENAIFDVIKGIKDSANATDLNYFFDVNKSRFDSARATDLNYFFDVDTVKFDSARATDLNYFLNVNKGNFDSSQITESLSYSIQKILSDIANSIDLVGINDGSTFQFNMVEADLVKISESIRLALHAFKEFTDSTTLNESLNYQFNKSISDIPIVSDNNIFDIQKIQSDISQIVEAISLSFNKDIPDYLNISENKVISTNKNIFDIVNVTEVISVFVGLKRFIDDIINVDENLSLAIEKALSDTTLAKDLLGVTDGSTFTFGMVEGDITTSTENLVFELNKILSDTPNVPDDYFLYQQTYFDSDYITNGQAYVVFNYRSELFDIYGLPFTESLDINDPIYLEFDKSVQDNIDISDTQLLLTDKNLSDITYVTDDISLQAAIAKVLSDTTLAKDLLGVTDGSTFTFGMVEGDLANVSEFISTILVAQRAFIDYAEASEIFTRIVTFIRNIVEDLEAQQTYELFTQNYFDSDYITNGQSYAVFNYRSPLVNIFGLPFAELLNANENAYFILGKPLSEVLTSLENSQLIFDKSISDTTNITELLRIQSSLNKALSDTTLARDLLGITDGSTFTFEMVEGDIANVNEVFTKTVEFNREFDEQVNITESLLALISFIRRFNESLEADQTYELFSQNYFDSDYITNGQSYAAFNYRSPTVNIFGLPFTESLEIPEIINLYLSKPLSEDLNALDDSRIISNKFFTEEIEVSEALIRNINKVLADTALAKDLLGVTDGSTFTFGMVEGDLANVSESIAKEVDYNRSFVEEITTTDLVELLLLINRNFIENLEADQTYELYTQNYFDSDYVVNGQSYAAFNYRSPTVNIFGLPFTELLNTPENTVIELDKILSDTLSVSENSEIIFDKITSDTLSVSENNVIAFNKSNTETIEISENIYRNINKILSDVSNALDLVGINDGSTFQFMMIEADLVQITESIILLVETFKDFIDSIDVEDPYVIYKQDYFDGDTYSKGYAAYEYRSDLSNGYYLPFNHVSNVNDIYKFNIDKIVNEQINANDTTNLDIDKRISDTAEVGDSGIISIQSYFAEDYVEYSYALESVAF